MKNKLKVVWYCYFTSSDIQYILKPYKQQNEFAPWIRNLITVFENDEEVELHIVSPHEWITGFKHFEQKGVFYHFFNKDIPFLGRHWPGFLRFDIWTDYFVLKSRFRRLVRKIQPDIIHMHGAENPFCTGITQFQGKYPVFITIQGFAHKHKSEFKVPTKIVNKEIEILKMFNHYGYRTQTMGEDIKAINPNAILHWHHYSVKIIDPIEVEKKYDIVFFARMSESKGIQDLLKAVSLIKKVKPDISLCAIGSSKTEKLQELAIELGIVENIFWAGFLPTQEDVHKMATTAKVSVLPTYQDIVSGTIVESMLLKLPVVAYNVGSIHEVNRDEIIITLVEKLDVEGLAISILELLNSEKLQEERAEKGYQHAIKMYKPSNDEIRTDLLKAYKAVIDDFQNN